MKMWELYTGEIVDTDQPITKSGCWLIYIDYPDEFNEIWKPIHRWDSVYSGAVMKGQFVSVDNIAEAIRTWV